MIDDFVVVGLESVPVVGNDERLGISLEGFWRLDHDEVIDKVVEGVQANLEKVQLRVDHDQVVYFAPARGRLWLEDGVAMGIAEFAAGFRIVVFEALLCRWRREI